MGADNHLTVVPENYDDRTTAKELEELLNDRFDLDACSTHQSPTEEYVYVADTDDTDGLSVETEKAIAIAHHYGYVPVGIIEDALRLVPEDAPEAEQP